jgi:signal peptidase I
MADELKPGSAGTTIKREGDFSRNSASRSGSKTLDEIRAGSGRGKIVTVESSKKESTWRSLVVALLIALLIRTFFVEAFRIPTGSMKNTLLVGDYLFVNKVAFFFRSPKYLPLSTKEIPYFSIKTGNIDRGDIIVFEYPGDKDHVIPQEKKINYIKRCIGLPGDSIQIINKQVYVNGQRMHNPDSMILKNRPLPKDEASRELFPGGTNWNTDWYGPIRIPKKGDVIQITPQNIGQWEVFIAREGHKPQIGDGGAITIDGKPVTSYTVERDYLWMMGDNRDDSADSRYWGFMPVENVIGSAMFIYWSWYNPKNATIEDGYDPDEEQNFHIRWSRIGKVIH